MRIGLFILFLAGSVSIILPLWADDNSKVKSVTIDESHGFPVIEHNRIAVTLIEESFSRTSDGKQVVTSFLFMVENKNDDPGQHSHRSPIRFFNSEGEIFGDASAGLSKSGTVTTQYNRRYLPDFENLPQPIDTSRTKLVRHWIHVQLPSSVNAVEVGFGQDGKNNTYRFPIRSQ